jgi:hypothetical protein
MPGNRGEKWHDTLMALISEEAFMKISASAPHILLGNGFSIALSKKVTYGQLMPRMLENSGVGPSLTEMSASDIEMALYVLEVAGKITKIASVHETIKHLHKGIRDEFIKLLAKIEPAKKSDVCSDQLNHCCKVLKKFGLKFTLNFDPFLYWAVLQEPDEWMNDGFRSDYGGGRLAWDYEVKVKTWWLHGALHQFVDHSEGFDLVYKVTANSDSTLMDQVSKELSQGRSPNAVLGGTWKQKRSHIQRSAYLDTALRNLESINGNIIVYGWSAAEQDDHIIKALGGKDVFFAVHEPSSPTGIEAEAKATSRDWLTFDSSWLDFWGPPCGICIPCRTAVGFFRTFH